MNNIINYESSIFEGIKHIDEKGNEYWLARELQKVFEYSKWENFHNVIKEAIISCKQSGYNIDDHFPEVGKMVRTGDSIRRIVDFKLSRLACYIIVQNGDPRKEIIALGQTYFAIQTRKQELSEQDYSLLSEDDKRLYTRELTRKGNLKLNQTAKKAGVKNFDKFHNAGYKGLYNGETADDIAKRKRLRYREDILDNMGSSELIANMFRIDLTEQKLRKENIIGEGNANNTHYKVGKKVRETIEELGGTLPEDLPTPEKSIKELEKNNNITSIYVE